MDVGISLSIRRHPDEERTLEQIYHDNIEDVQYAEELGFTHAWNCEHHFAWDQWSPAQFPVLSTLAARTSTIRIGSHVIVLPYHHPLRVAEDAAVLDILSGGRLDLAVGAGSVGEEFKTFGIDAGERFGRLYEGVDILVKCFTEDEFDYHGKYFDFTAVRMTTKPLQKPLPIWVAASGPVGVKRVARRGLNVTGATGFGLVGIFDEELRASGLNPHNHGSMFIHIVHVADTWEQAWDEAELGVHHWLSFYSKLDWLVGKLDVPDVSQLRYWTGSPIPYHVGTPEQVAASLRDHLDAGRHTNLALEFRHALMTTSAVRRSMELFAEHVLPDLRSRQPTGPVPPVGTACLLSATGRLPTSSAADRVDVVRPTPRPADIPDTASRTPSQQQRY